MTHRSFPRRFLSILAAFTVLLAGFAPSAAAAGRAGARGTTRTSVNQSASANRNVNRNTDVNRNTNVNRNTDVNRNTNVNVDRDINVDVDDDWDRFDNDWDDHPVAAGVALGTAAVITSAVIGSMVYSLPPSCSTMVVHGIAYQQCGGTWYQPQYAGTQVTYIVVNPPQ